MGAFGEAAPIRIEIDDLGYGPYVEMVGVVALLHPIDGHVGAGVEWFCDDALRGPAPILQGPGGDPPAPGKKPRSDHAADIEVIALVPAVVRPFKPLVRLPQGEQHAADLDRVVVDAPDFEWIWYFGLAVTDRGQMYSGGRPGAL